MNMLAAFRIAGLSLYTIECTPSFYSGYSALRLAKGSMRQTALASLLLSVGALLSTRSDCPSSSHTTAVFLC